MKSCWRSAGLDDRDVSEPGLHVLPHRLDVLAGIRAGEGLPDDFDGFLQALVADSRSRAAGPGDVLVEIWSVPVPDIAVNAG